MFGAVPCSSSGGQIVLLQPGIVTLCKRPYSMPVESGLFVSSYQINAHTCFKLPT